MKTSDIIWNISSTKQSESKASLLNKGLSFCTITKECKKEQLLDDVYFCQTLKLKKYFYDGESTTIRIQQKEKMRS